MKTMLEHAIDFIHRENNHEFSFYEIFDYVQEKMQDQWNEKFVSDSNSFESVRELKMGELYRIMTVDHRFARTADGNWISNETN